MEDVLSKTLDGLRKKYGDQAVVRLGDAPRDIFGVQVIPTGILDLDLAIGAGGFPRGRIIEIYGAEGSGKTTVALHAIARAQKLGCSAAFIDMERALDPDLAAAYGVGPELIICQPACGEDAIDAAEALLRSGVDLVVVDSVAALIPLAEASDDMAKNYIGNLARLMSKAMRKLVPALNANPARRGVVVFLNQIREKVGVMFGDPRVTMGGRGLRFFASVRIELASPNKEDAVWARGSSEGAEDDESRVQIGHIIRMRVAKNKVGVPFKKASALLVYGVGIDQADQALRVGMRLGLVKQSGATYRIEGCDGSLRGREAALAFLRDHPDVIGSIEAAARGIAARGVTDEGGDAS